MADGVEYGLRALSKRDEGHRILFVVTDGMPNGGHEAIIKNQHRRAAKAGIVLIGVGITTAARRVGQVFPNFVDADDLAHMPAQLVKKLSDILIPATRGRHRRLKDA